MPDEDPQDPLRAVEALHARVDREAARLAAHHAERLTCHRGCSGCCQDGLTVFEVEAERLRRGAPEVLAGEPGPEGGCAFLDEAGACRVYALRPFVCRTQGLPLRWFLEDEEGELVEERGICELNAEGPPLEELDDDRIWTLGTVELELGRLQRKATPGQEPRVALRSLFGAD